MSHKPQGHKHTRTAYLAWTTTKCEHKEPVGVYTTQEAAMAAAKAEMMETMLWCHRNVKWRLDCTEDEIKALVNDPEALADETLGDYAYGTDEVTIYEEPREVYTAWVEVNRERHNIGTYSHFGVAKQAAKDELREMLLNQGWSIEDIESQIDYSGDMFECGDWGVDKTTLHG